MAKEDQQQKGVWATRALGGGDTFTIFLILTTMLLLSQINTTHGNGVDCYSTFSETTWVVIPQKSFHDAVSRNADPHTTGASITDPDNSIHNHDNQWCYVVYHIDGRDTAKTKWDLQPHTYTASGDGYRVYDINVCDNKVRGCRMATSRSKVDPYAWRLDAACCCNEHRCNSDISMDPQIYFETQLNSSKHQICRVGNTRNKRIANCSRLTGKKETDSPSKCLSVLVPPPRSIAAAVAAAAYISLPDDMEFGCAHNNATDDQCDWANGENGVCRVTHDDKLQCCCNGPFCNGEAMMDLTCRAQYWNTSDLRYGKAPCEAQRPTTTTVTVTTTTAESNTLMWTLIGVGIAVVLLLIIIVIVALCCWRRKKKKQSAFVTRVGPIETNEPSDSYTTLDSDMPTEDEKKPDEPEEKPDEPAEGKTPKKEQPMVKKTG